MKDRIDYNSSLASVVMGSKSDWSTMKHCCNLLDEFQIQYEKKNRFSS